MKRFSFLLVLFCLLSGGPVFAANYWVSFGMNGEIYLMKINDFGQILAGPEHVSDSLEYVLMTALSDRSQNTVTVWAIDDADDFPFPIHRINVNKDTFASSGEATFPVKNEPFKSLFSLSTTQNISNRLLVFTNPQHVLKAFGLASNMTWDGRKFRISPRTTGSFWNGGIAPDGRMSWAIAHLSDSDSKLYLQGLRSNGLPIGDPRVAGASTADFSLRYADLSNPLPGNKRFLIYELGKPFDTDIVYLQQVNSSTGEKQGGKKQITSPFPWAEQGIWAPLAIDPNGHFILYIAEADCGGMEPVYSIYFQALDATGNPSGSPHGLLDCAFLEDSEITLGLDILQE